MSAEARQAVVEAVRELVSAEEPWTSRRKLRQRTRDGTAKTVLDVTKDEADNLIRELVAEGEIVYWHGLLTVNEKEYLTAAIEAERDSGHPREVLIGKLNKVLAGKWDFSKDEPAALTDGGDA